jgi:hypothetical protein
MKSTQLEILVFTGTSFSSKQFSERYNTSKQNYFSEHKSLETASWNGLVPELLPELYNGVRNRKKMILWNVIPAKNFLELDYAEQPREKEKPFSLNPYFFMTVQRWS